ncbi:gamma-glutamyltransferase [Thalassobaculum sp.]|uniref:gamma-glutamyltransferase n=1 Tax=Thalassobaculum sp. TaxID=2022740 RepID=UPI0032EF0F1D
MPAVSLPDSAPIETWSVSKPAVAGRRGVVASQNVEASQVGAAVLAAGGNAIDAAIATALALCVAEPWMSGLGGGGYAIVHDGKSGATKVVDFGMIAPRGLDPANYGIDTGRSAPPDLFSWPAVVEDRNLQGFHSIAVPGSCAGYATLLENFGSWSWADTIGPALAMARRGHRLTWWSTLQIAAEAGWLGKYPGSGKVWLPGGLVPSAPDGPPPFLPMGALADTFERLQKAGPSDFYTGETGRRLVADLNAGGSAISMDDLAAYRARIVDPIVRERAGHTLNLVPGYTAGPTFAGALARLPEKFGTASPDAATYGAYAKALIEAYKVRLETMGHAGDVGDRSCTTHLSAVDADGNMVVITTTLLSRFGSRVVLPETGVLMNNGINWFDPRPGRPNSLAAGERPLSNMCPMLATRDGRAAFGLGASGGRKIMPAIFQLTSFIGEFGMGLERALRQPRIDVGLIDTIVADDRLDAASMQALQAVAPVRPAQAVCFPAQWAIPNAVALGPDGPLGAAHPYGPLPAAVGA